MSDTKQQRDTLATFTTALNRRGNLPAPAGEISRQIVGRRKDAQAFVLAVDRVRVDKDQVRRLGKGPDDPETQQLAATIKDHGLLAPVDVRWLAAEDVYEIVAGERRFTAVKDILGWQEIPVRIVEVAADQVIWLQLIENLHRKGLHALDLAAAIRAALDGGMSQAEVALKLYKSETWVQKALTVAKDLSAAAGKVLRRAGKGSMDTAYQVATVPAEKQQELAENVEARGLNVRETRAAAKDMKKDFRRLKSGRSGRPPGKSYSRTFTASNGIRVTVQAGQAPELAELLAALEEAQKTFAGESHGAEAA